MISAATAAARTVLPGPDPIWVALDTIIGLAMTALVFALIKVLPDTLVRDVYARGAKRVDAPAKPVATRRRAEPVQPIR